MKKIFTFLMGLIIPTLLLGQSVSFEVPVSTIKSLLDGMANGGVLSAGVRYSPSQLDPIGDVFGMYLRKDGFSVGLKSCSSFTVNSDTLFSTTFKDCNLWTDAVIQQYTLDLVRLKRHVITDITINGKIKALYKADTLYIKLETQTMDISNSESLAGDSWLYQIASLFHDFSFPTPNFSEKIEIPIALVNLDSNIDPTKKPTVTINSSTIKITATYKFSPPVIEAVTQAGLADNIGKFLVKKENESTWREPQKSGFAVFTDWNLNEHNQIKSRDRLLSQGSEKLLFSKFMRKIDKFEDLNTLTGERQIDIMVQHKDEKHTAVYDPAKLLSLSGNFEQLPSVTGSFEIQGVNIGSSFSDYYPKNDLITYPLKALPNTSLGLSWQFLNWSDGVTTANRTVLVNQDISLTANWKAMMASKSAGWVQSATPYSGNGTKAIVYKTPNGTGEDVWLHTESSAGIKETLVNDVGLPDATNAWSLAASDYNGQKQYYAKMMIDKNTGLNLTIEEYVNGQRTSILLNDYFYLTDLGASSLSLTAKVYVSPYANTTGFPATYTNFLVVVVDGLKVYSKVAVMNNGAVYSWGPWSTFTATSAPVVSTNGKTMYINWIENGNLVGRRFLNTSWGSTYTLYSNSGGNFINFTTAVNSTDDLVLMMTRQNTGSQVKAMCFGKRYISGSSAPITVLESSTYGGYSAYSLAAEGTKLLVSVGKTPDGETPMSYYLWKNDGTTWTKETTAFSSTPARLLHNEVDVRPYEFATATTPALYALKTTPVSWGGNGLEKADQETGLSVVAARLGDTLTWYTTVDPESVDSMLVDTTGLWHIVVKTEEAREILISGLNRFGSAVWVDSSRTVQFTPAEARYTFWVVDPTGNKMRYAKDQADPEEAEFKLEDQVSVFPNPFNPATVFSVTVAEPSRVKLHIYNVIGQQVAEIVNTDLTAGVHDYRLNAGSWASGTYFYRLQIGDKLKSGKIQLVK